MRKIIIPLCLVFAFSAAYAQNSDSTYYRSVPDYPERYTAGAVASRMLDGLGFRYYWATEGLRQEDLSYSPGEHQRTTSETLEHIYYMSVLIANTVLGDTLKAEKNLPYRSMRKQTLLNIKKASLKCRMSSEEELNAFVLKLQNGAEIPFWNFINGPIADCIWHCGQVVSFRRTSGNPINPNLSFFMGRPVEKGQ